MFLVQVMLLLGLSIYWQILSEKTTISFWVLCVIILFSNIYLFKRKKKKQTFIQLSSCVGLLDSQDYMVGKTYILKNKG